MSSTAQMMLSYGAPPDTDTLPALATPGVSYVARYDATSDDAAKMTLARAGVMTAAAVNAGGVDDRVQTLKNRITTGSPLPDMAKIAAGSVRQNGARWLKNIMGNLGGLYFDDNERGLATATGTGIALTTSTAYTVIDIFTLDRARSARTSATYSIASYIGSATSESSGNNNLLVAGTAAAPHAIGPAAGKLGVIAWNQSGGGTYAAQDGTERSVGAQTCCVIRRAIPSAAAAVSGQTAGTMKTFINAVGTAMTCLLRDNTGTSRLAIGNNPSGGATSFFRGIYHEQIVIAGAINDADVATLMAWADARYYNLIGDDRAVTMTAAIGQSNSLAKMAGFWGGSAADGADYWNVTGEQVVGQLFGALG